MNRGDFAILRLGDDATFGVKASCRCVLCAFTRSVLQEVCAEVESNLIVKGDGPEPDGTFLLSKILSGEIALSVIDVRGAGVA